MLAASRARISNLSRSRKGAWIEMQAVQSNSSPTIGRSRKGAWIEIHSALRQYFDSSVAPVRERGLKYCHKYIFLQAYASLP